MSQRAKDHCPTCSDEWWVCENHRDKAWPDQCDCGAGEPCPDCNASEGRDDPPRMPPGFRETGDITQ